jgi:SWI/SNF-related matrix-associated actin-dependent regulator of chromatin subfamily A member 5
LHNLYEPTAHFNSNFTFNWTTWYSIDALIARGEERTSEMQAKLQTDVQHNLRDFSLMADDDINTFSFDGKNYRESDKNSGGLLINLPQRQRKRYYDLGAENKGAGGIKAHAAETAAKKKKKGPALHDFQLFDMERLNSLIEKERSLVSKKEEHIKKIRAVRNQAQNAPALGSGVAEGYSREELVQQADRMSAELETGFTLTKEEEREKEKLLAEGFK